MRLDSRLIVLALAFALEACGSLPVVLGGISSTGGKPGDDDDKRKTSDASTAPQAPVPDENGAAMACGAATALGGASFRLEPGAAPADDCVAAGAARSACLVAVSFGEAAATLTFADGSEATATAALCGSTVRLHWGEDEVDLTVAADRSVLTQTASGRVFRR